MHATLIKGGVHSDNRGVLTFFNDFDMNPIKRFYTTTHFDETVIRAWQGHQYEQKWFYVVEGSFKVILVEPDDWTSPSANLPYEEFLLNSKNNEILNIPSGMATGFQALEASSKLMIFSDVTLAESINDDYRFDNGLWYKW
ncbi:WxcM-like domain-containing protein [Pedobacter punctiformis]|uniref:dTDP-4-dehydrorhamnose 3,5-epimerase family protein n=1 Tax=Pedobacter punctiformis TaxID=3004097 RepID=A0ABT4L705_9SPHI|nr:WxcM-like domain-containing protein [Pedobacter sp. HCMS5-2]MCZ4242913.1 dTDP-4-dehydrorhamnose 3,5-epimerase family protein [Pedobacter sp. HCMS5-2]